MKKIKPHLSPSQRLIFSKPSFDEASHCGGLPTIKNKLSFGVFLATCGVMVGASSSVFADTANVSTQHSGALEEILVTAQKRIENIQDVPKSVDVKTQEDFDKSGVTKLENLANAVPSISSTAGVAAAGSAPAIRGIKTITQSVGVQSKTGVMVDEIAQPTFSTLPNQLIDVERIEVFAGPQSTLSGRNAAGGVISITTRAPSHTPELDLGLVQTSDDQTRVTLFGTGPISDTLAFSLASYWDYQDGQTFSPLEDKYVGDSYNKGGRGKLQWEATDNLTATLTGYYVESNNDTNALGASGNQGFIKIPSFLASFYPLWDGTRFTKEVYQPEHGQNTTRDRGLSLHVDYEIQDLGTLSSLTNYQKSDQLSNTVLFGEPRDLISKALPGTGFGQDSSARTKFFSQEVRLVSEEMDPWTYLVGGIFSKTDLTNTTVRTFGSFTDNDSTDVIDSYALFGHATYSFSDSDSLTVGLRYQYDKNRYTYDNNLPPNPVPTKSGGSSSGDSGYGFWGEEASYKHYFTPSVNAYLTIARTESGEAYDLNDDVNGKSKDGLSPLKSETAKNIEIGLKSHLFHDKVTLNVDAFLTKYEHYQIQATDSTDLTNIVTRTYSVGKVETRGLETTAAWQASPGLRFDLGAALTDAIITSYPGAPCYAKYQTAAQGCVTNTDGTKEQDIDGARMPDAPRFKYTAAADYTIFLSNLPFDANMGVFYRHQSGTNYDVFANPLLEQNGYGVTNIYAGLISHDDKYRLQWFMNNVFDQHYYTNVRSDPVLSSFASVPVVVGSTSRDSFRYTGIRFDAKFK